MDMSSLTVLAAAVVQISALAYGYGKLNAKVESIRDLVCSDTKDRIQDHERHCANFQPNTAVRPNPIL